MGVIIRHNPAAERAKKVKSSVSGIQHALQNAMDDRDAQMSNVDIVHPHSVNSPHDTFQRSVSSASVQACLAHLLEAN